MTSPPAEPDRTRSPKPEIRIETEPSLAEPPPPIPEEPPPLEEYDHEPRVAHHYHHASVYGLPPIDDEPIKEQEEEENWRPYSPYGKTYSEDVTMPKSLHKPQKSGKNSPEDSPAPNGQDPIDSTSVRAKVVQILPSDIDDIESRKLTCRRAKCPLLLGMFLGLTVLLCIGILIAWAILTDGFQNMGGLSRVCNSKECIETAAQLDESIDQHENICNNFYRHICGHFHASNPTSTDHTIDYTTKLQEMMENRLNEIFLNFSPGSATPFSLQFSAALYQSCINPIRPSLQALPLVNLLKNLPCSPMLPFCQGFSSAYFSWERYAGMMDWYAGSYNFVLYDRGPNPQAPGQILLTFSAIDLSGILAPIKAHVSSLGPKGPTELEALLSVEIKQKIVMNTVQGLLAIDINSTDPGVLDMDELTEMFVELDNLATWSRQTSNVPTVMSLQEFAQLIDPIDVKSILDASLTSVVQWSWSDLIVVNQIEYYKALPRLLSKFSKRSLANYLTIVTSLNLKKYLQLEQNDNMLVFNSLFDHF